MHEILDVLIIGGGPIGLACGLEARKAGLSYLILEKGVLVNSLYHYPSNMTFFSTSERIEIGDIPFVSNNIKPTRPEALEYYRRIAVSQKLNIHLHETVVEVLHQGENYKVKTSISGIYRKEYHHSNRVLRYTQSPAYSRRRFVESETLLQRASFLCHAKTPGGGRQ